MTVTCHMTCHVSHAILRDAGGHGLAATAGRTAGHQLWNSQSNQHTGTANKTPNWTKYPDTASFRLHRQEQATLSQKTDEPCYAPAYAACLTRLTLPTHQLKSHRKTLWVHKLPAHYHTSQRRDNCKNTPCVEIHTYSKRRMHGICSMKDSWVDRCPCIHSAWHWLIQYKVTYFLTAY